ncbi:DUF2141 domain-containing protein [Nodularia sphaerocarpa]|uniref:DUF2141 domain-containing protein n=1 Tax=Nodularia sphaerocarpa TaxID=137816 RepID=UPI001EFB50BF|nr:DUF2141 domain-containing protein [Nodularia sphaerocarpa]MDB9375827.1 DUF2141 domain-containing protein [Nodularia sphaerocarpa CS-585]MDB9377065.1 DUF2141 domain-containing protein [Nodularia sphaerocarpa CS-585A2]ULP71855.1 hypothetical protein BDGGKGIB_01491 [Nodularia sphaerocarpa UHCC 0038]
MWKITHFSRVLLATLLSISFARTVNAEPTAKLTVVVDNIKNQNGEVCMGVYSSSQGFPMSTKDVIKSACVQPTGSILTHEFSGLKPGTYAVAIVDDQNGDRKLNKDFLGIPKEGFGISRNPTVSIATGTPSFYDSSFILMPNQNTTINILMKYSLDS